MALVGAVIVLGAIYYILRRRELVLDKSDAWSSFWTNLAKHALLRLNKQKINMRNWRPNIILFSGSKQARPHLIELGLALTGKLGAITNFELEITDEKNLPIQPIQKEQKLVPKLEYFNRKFRCNTLEEGIKTITSVYGFSGFEPNTIMMGWSRDTEKGDFLTNVLTDFRNKNLNAVLLDYDKNHGFGKKENIDIWWNGKGRVFSFSISLCKFILSSSDWRDARLRILVINNDTTITDRIHRNTSILLEEARISAEIKIIENGFENRTTEMIIRTESEGANLVMIGISQRSKQYTSEYIKTINNISSLPASLLILCPSSEFEEINLIDSAVKKTLEFPDQKGLVDLAPIPEITNETFKIRIEKLDNDYLQMTNQFVTDTFEKALKAQLTYVLDFNEQISMYFEDVKSELDTISGTQLLKSLHNNHQSFLNYFTGFFEKKAPAVLAETKETLTTGLNTFQDRLGNYVFESPETIIVEIKTEKKTKNRTIPYRKILNNHFNHKLNAESFKQLITLERSYGLMYTSLKDIILNSNELFENLIKNPKERHEKLKTGSEKILNEIKLLEAKIQNQLTLIRSSLQNTVREQVISFVNNTSATELLVSFKSKVKSRHSNNQEQLNEFPDEWFSNFVWINNSLYLDCFVLLNKKMSSRIISRTDERIINNLTENLLNPVNQLLSTIDQENLSGKISIPEIKTQELFLAKTLFQETLEKVSQFTAKFPALIEIPDRKIDEINTSENQNTTSPIQVEPYKIARHTLDTLFFEPYYRMLMNLEAQAQQMIEDYRENCSLIKFRYSNIDLQDDLEINHHQNQINIINKLSFPLQKIKVGLSHEIDQLNDQSESLIRSAYSPLFSHSIIDSEKNLKNQVREHKGKKFNLGLRRALSRIKSFSNDQIVNLLNSRSSGMILAKKYLRKDKTQKVTTSQILDLTEKLMPDNHIFAQIPIFYVNLFKSKSFINDDFWVPREEESQKIKNARKRQKEGHVGAILITGEHGSGKTALTRWSTNHLFRKAHIYTVKPPVNGSVNPKDWIDSLQKATNLNESVDEIAGNLPVDSVIVINDLELWWERSNEGYAVIEEIINLIQKYSRKIFFILNCNIHSYHVINKIFPIDDSLLAIIECGPLDSKQIQQLISKRHKSSGLSFEYKNQSEDQIHPVRMAQLFNSYYDYSKGNPGVVLGEWLRNINSVDDQIMNISSASMPDTEFLDFIDKDWLIVIALFIQHKNMNAEKLARIMTMNIEDAEIYINRFFNSGILTLREGNVYTLNRYLEPFIVKVCIEKGII